MLDGDDNSVDFYGDSLSVNYAIIHCHLRELGRERRVNWKENGNWNRTGTKMEIESGVEIEIGLR